MVRVTITTLIFCVAYFIPDLTSLLGILGALFGSTIQYILPILMHWKVFRGPTLARKTEYLLLLIIAFIAIVLGLYQSIREMLKRYE
jgi:ABC-type antimicrobial peptide transport system permease subunit